MSKSILHNSQPSFFTEQVLDARRFYIEGVHVRSERLKIVCGGYEVTNSAYVIDRPDFPYYSVEYVSKGSGKVRLGDREYSLSTGSVFSYGPGVSQHITNTVGNEMSKYFIDFVGSSAGKYLRRSTCGLGKAVKVGRPDIIEELLDTLIEHGLSDKPHKTLLCSKLLDYLLIRIADLSVVPLTAEPRAFGTYQECRNLIHEKFLRLHTLEDIACACGTDSAHICKLFKRFDTITPYRYLTNLKMAYAAELLHEPNILIKQVAERLCFRDQYHFTRTFKKVFGITPSEFKNLR